MTPTHEQIIDRLKDLFPGADHHSVSLDLMELHGRRVHTIYIHMGELCESFDNFEEMDKWINERGSYRRDNEILFRKFEVAA